MDGWVPHATRTLHGSYLSTKVLNLTLTRSVHTGEFVLLGFII